MYLLSQLWTYLLAAGALGALLGAACYALCRRGAAQQALIAVQTRADTEAAALRNRIADVDAQRMQAVERLSGLDAQFETLRTSSERALEAFADRIRELETKLHEREAQFRAAEARMGGEVAAHGQVRNRLREVSEALTVAEAARAAAQADRERMEAELASLRDEVVGARGLVHELNAAARGREDALQAEITELRDHLGETRVRLLAAQQGEHALKAETDSQVRLRDEREREFELMRQKLEAAQAALARAEDQETTRNAEIDRLRERLAEADAATREASERHGRLDSEVASLRDQGGTELRALQDELAAVTAAMEAAQQRERAAQRSEDGLRAQLDGLRATALDAEQAVARLRAELQQQASRGEQSAEALASERARVRSLEQELNTVRRQLVELAAETKRAGEAQQRLRDELAGLDAREAASSQEAARLRAALDDGRRSAHPATTAGDSPAVLPDAADVSRRNARPDFKPSLAASMEAATLEELVLAAGDGRRPGNAIGSVPGDIDDLKEIGGIGPVNEKWLHDQGIFHFWQIASWEPEELAWVAQNLPNFGTRVYRENWVAQATRLARGENTDARRKYKAGKHV